MVTLATYALSGVVPGFAHLHVVAARDADPVHGMLSAFAHATDGWMFPVSLLLWAAGSADRHAAFRAADLAVAR